MSEFIGEDAFVMPAVSTARLVEIGQVVLAELAPEALTKPTALDLVRLVERVLPKHGINVGPASEEELGGRHAATDPSGTGAIEVLIRDDHWESLYRDGARAVFARSTIAHELSHCVLHVHVLRRRRDHPLAGMLLNRVARGKVEPFRDSEWQAHALAACILMPRRTLQMVEHPTVTTLASMYGVSTGFVQSHLRRLKLELR